MVNISVYYILSKMCYCWLCYFIFVVINHTITRCDGSYLRGRHIFVNFKQINQPCDCTFKAKFSGILLVTATSDGYYECRNQIILSLDTSAIVFNCKGKYPVATTFNVVNNETVVNVKANYTNSYTSGNFFLCLAINQNGTVYVIILLLYYFKYSFGTWFTISHIPTLYGWNNADMA